MGQNADRRTMRKVRSIAIVAGIAASAGIPAAAFAADPAPPPIELTSPVGATFTRGLAPPDPVLRFGVRNATDRPLLIGAPVLCSFGAGEGRLSAGTAEVSTTPSQEKLDPQAVREISLTITGVTSAGNYKGRVCFPGGKDASGAERGKLDVDFTLVVKDSGWYAFAAIVTGVVGSELVRAWLRTGRRRLVQRIDAKRLAAALAALRDRVKEPGVLDVIGVVSRQIEKFDSDVAQRAEPTIEDALDAFAVKVPLAESWADLRIAVLALDPGDSRTSLLAALDAPEALLRNPRATRSELDSSLKSIQAISVTPAERQTLLAALADLESMIAQPGFKNAQESPEMKAIRAKAAEARAALDADDRTVARERIFDARGRIAPLLTNTLLAALEKSAPRGFLTTTWEALRTRLTRELESLSEDPRVALNQYRASYAEYATEHAKGLIGEIEDALRALPAGESPERKSFEDMKKKLQDLQQATSMRDAPAVLGAAVELLDEHSGPATAQVRTVSGGGAAAIPPSEWPEGEEGASTKSPARRAEELTKDLRSWDGAVACALFVVASLSGLRVLWATPDVWGSSADYLAAILWGFALQSVGTAPFEGFGALRDRLTKLAS